jgi:hypothetical protein
MTIRTGSMVTVKDAEGRMLHRIAASDVTPGRDFDVVWLARPEEWEAAQAEGREPIITPWPAEDVLVSEEVAPAAPA